MYELAPAAAVLIGCFLGVVTIGIYIKRQLSWENLSELALFIVNKAANDADTQKDLYQIGGIIGQGIKTGVGMTTGGRRAGMWDAVIQLAGQFNQQKQSAPQNGPPLVDSDPQKLNL